MAEVEILYNKERAVTLMEQSGVEAVVATTPENILYITGLPLRTTNWNMQIYAVLPKDQHKKLAIIIPTNRLSVLSQKGIPDANVYVYGTFYLQGTPTNMTKDMEVLMELLKDRHIYNSPTEALLTVFSDLGLSNQAIAIDEMRMSPSVLAQVKQQYAGQLPFGYDLIRKIRLVKTPQEIQRLRKAAQLNEEGEMMMIHMVHDGVGEIDLAQAFREFATKTNSTTGMVAVGGGPRSALPLIEEYLYHFQKGDLVRFDLCFQHNGYWSDTGRTAVLGQPTPEQAHCFEAIHKGWETALSMIRPGAVASDIFEHAIAAVITAGIPDYKRQHVGHAIGLEIYDDLLLGPSDHTPLEENMVINVEVPYYLLGFGGFQVEDSVVVTKDGFEFLTGAQRILHICE